MVLRNIIKCRVWSINSLGEKAYEKWNARKLKPWVHLIDHFMQHTLSVMSKLVEIWDDPQIPEFFENLYLKLQFDHWMQFTKKLALASLFVKFF